MTPDLKLDNAGVKVVPESLKIAAENEETNVSNIYAVGDVLHVRIIVFVFIVERREREREDLI